MAAEAFQYRRRGRSRAALLTVGLVWLVLLAAIVLLDAAWWLVAIIGFFSLPAIWELISNPEAGLDLDDSTVRWFSGRREAQMALSEIAKLRLDTRLDFSVRATLVPHEGHKIRLPYECTPPHEALEQAFADRGIASERHHFSLIG